MSYAVIVGKLPECRSDVRLSVGEAVMPVTLTTYTSMRDFGQAICLALADYVDLTNPTGMPTPEATQ